MTTAATISKNQSTKMQIGEEDQNHKRNEQTDAPRTPLMALNHVTHVCRSVETSIEFYTKVLGFELIQRPETFDFDGAWLFNYGVGIHLVRSKDEEKLPRHTDGLDPMDSHISFQCDDMEEMERTLKSRGVNCLKRTVGGDDKDGTPVIDQLFFKDPDGFMIEICNCEKLKLKPQSSMADIKLPPQKHHPPVELSNGNDGAGE